MSLDNVIEQTAGIIPLAIVGGLAVNMTQNLMGSNQVKQKQSSNSPIKRGARKAEENAYTRNRYAFSSKYSPF